MTRRPKSETPGKTLVLRVPEKLFYLLKQKALDEKTTVSGLLLPWIIEKTGYQEGERK